MYVLIHIIFATANKAKVCSMGRWVTTNLNTFMEAQTQNTVYCPVSIMYLKIQQADAEASYVFSCIP